MSRTVPSPENLQAMIDFEKDERNHHQREYVGVHPASCPTCARTRRRITTLLAQKRDAESALTTMAAAVRSAILGPPVRSDYALVPPGEAAADAAEIPAPADRTLYRPIDVDSGDPVFVVQLVVQAHKGARGKELLDQFEEACKANGWDILAGQTEEKKQ